MQVNSAPNQKQLSALKNKKIAIVHDYLHEYGGAEGVVNAMWEMFPHADIYTATYDPDVMKKAGAFQGAKIFYPKWRDSIPGAIKRFMHKVLIANLPLYFERLDLSKYDLVISSTAHFAKGVKTQPDQVHISYIHTPPRFLYGLQGEIRKRDSWLWKPILWPLDAYLRRLDQKFAQRPDHLVCNSKTVQERIKKYYNRDAVVINPFPEVKVSQQDFEDAKKAKGDYFLIVSRLAAYKNVDLAIKVCGKNNLKLRVAGKGPAEERFRRLAENYITVKMLGFVSDKDKTVLYKNCKAVICAVRDEDFGMAALEPMMFSKPVVAIKQGGFLETVNERVGVFFDELTEDALFEALQKVDEKIEEGRFDPDLIRSHANLFNKDRFKKEFGWFVGKYGIR